MLKSAFRVIPVLDVKEGLAVHAVAGQRSHYRPVRSLLHSSADPLELARAYRDILGLQELYVADLGAIARGEQDHALYSELTGLGLEVWIDAGVRSEFDLPGLVENRRITIVVGLETVRGASDLEAVLRLAGADRVVFSLDLFAGVPRVSADAAWISADPEQLASQLVDLGVRRLLLLDLSRVGTGTGTGTESLQSLLLAGYPGLDISVGGGISGINEIRAFRDSGAAAVLVGSALHDGRIDRRELDQLRAEKGQDAGPEG
jgi:phosphoribosylformimino-5-aminoimidazole carboxamide ribotide isomerase